MKKNKKHWGVVLTSASTGSGFSPTEINKYWFIGKHYADCLIDKQGRTIFSSKKDAMLCAGSFNKTNRTFEARVLSND